MVTSDRSNNQNKGTIIISGGAKRIGAIISRNFAANGWRVIIHYNNSAPEAEDLRREITKNGGTAETIAFDLNDCTNADNFIKGICNKYDDVLALINNASVFEYDNAKTIDTHIFQKAMNVNCLTPILMAQAFAKYSPQKEIRHIINILDQKLDNLNPDYFSYTLSKASLAVASQMMAMQMADDNVIINNISPGLTMLSADQTAEEFATSSKMNLLNRPVNPQAIADAAFMLINNNIQSGTTIHVDCGQHLVKQNRDVMFLVRE